MSDLFIVKLSHKGYYFARTESGFFEISEADILANGLIPNAAPTPDLTVADLVAQAERQQRQKSKRRPSNMKQFQKEVV